MDGLIDFGVVESLLHHFPTAGKTGSAIVNEGTDAEKLELLRLAGDDCTSDSGIDRVAAEILVNHFRGIFESARVRNTAPLPTGAEGAI